MSKPANAPDYAIPIPPPRGPFPSEQLDQVAGIKSEVTRENAVNRYNFDGACQGWLMGNSRNRDFGIAITPKPSPFVPQVVHTGEDTETNSGVLWLWIAGGAPVFCPDLEPLKAPAGPNNIHIGKHNYGQFWQTGEDNTFNNDTVDVPGSSEDGVTGVWRFLGSAMSAGRGWYRKVS